MGLVARRGRWTPRAARAARAAARAPAGGCAPGCGCPGRLRAPPRPARATIRRFSSSPSDAGGLDVERRLHPRRGHVRVLAPRPGGAARAQLDLGERHHNAAPDVQSPRAMRAQRQPVRPRLRRHARGSRGTRGVDRVRRACPRCRRPATSCTRSRSGRSRAAAERWPPCSSPSSREGPRSTPPSATTSWATAPSASSRRTACAWRPPSGPSRSGAASSMWTTRASARSP